jgi:hypothetical protein
MQTCLCFGKEAQKLHLVLLISFGANAYRLVWDSWIQWYFFELTFSFYELSAFYRRLSFVLLWPLLQEVHVLTSWCEALLYISGFLLTVEHGYNSKSLWYFKTQVCQVKSSFECVQNGSSKDGIIWVCHVDHIEGDVFGVGVIGSAKGYWECDSSNGLDSFPAEAIERLREVPELLLIKSHFVEGC